VWAVHGGRLGKVVHVDPILGVLIVYADDGAGNDFLQSAALAAAGPAQVPEGEAILADPGLPARRTAAWAAGGAPGVGAWARVHARVPVHGGRLGKVFLVHPDCLGGMVKTRYADDGVQSDLQGPWSPQDVAAAAPSHVAEGEAQLDALGAAPPRRAGGPS
jgi:hypothetical protein